MHGSEFQPELVENQEAIKLLNFASDGMDDADLELDPDEETANREVDSMMAPRIFNTIDELVKFNSERDVLFQAVLAKIRAAKTGKEAELVTLVSRIRKLPNKMLPDTSSMFNTVGSSDGSIERVQQMWTDYLRLCLEVVQTVREITRN